MKGDFIIKFITGVIEFAGELHDGWSRIPYKCFRYSDFNINGYSARRTYSNFKNFEYRGLIKGTGDDSFKFTKEGEVWAQKIYVKYFKNRYRKWDKKWRVVIFDIPREFNRKRDTLRRRLRYMGFFMLQRSVFVLPYPCEEELSDLCETLNVGDYVDIITANSIGSREDELRQLYKI